MKYSNHFYGLVQFVYENRGAYKKWCGLSQIHLIKSSALGDVVIILVDSICTKVLFFPNLIQCTTMVMPEILDVKKGGGCDI